MKQNQEKSSIRRVIGRIPGRREAIDCIGLSGSERAYLVSHLYAELDMPMVVIVPSLKEAELFLGDLNFFLESASERILCFPPYNILPFQYLSDQSETAADRIRTLYRLIVSEIPPLLITTVDALLQKLVPKKELTRYAELIMVEEELDLEGLTQKLLSGGYVRSMMVEEPGEFSVRGGILDVFSPLYASPLRVEFYGDTVDSLRLFSPETQRTVQRIQEAVILPAREAILIPENRNETLNRVREQASKLDMPVREVRKLIDQIKNKAFSPGVETIIPMIHSKPATFFDYLPDHMLFILTEPNSLDKAAADFENQAEKNYHVACNEKRFCLDPKTAYLDWSTAKEIIRGKKPITFKYYSMVSGESMGTYAPLEIRFSVAGNTELSEELKRRREKEHLLAPLADWINENIRFHRTTLLVCRTRVQAERLKSLLDPYGIPNGLISQFSHLSGDPGRVGMCLGQLTSGFVWQDEHLAVITEDEIFGVKPRRRSVTRKSVRTDLLSFDELKKGDLVVHLDHGIGQYQGLVKLKLDGPTNDYLLILFKGDDKLYLPIDRMNVIQKYIGVDGIVPVLARLGGASWERVKNRVKRSVEKIAGALLELYAERKVRSGVAFREPDSYFKDFEAGFPYEETEDQVKAIDDVLLDMQQPMPMDRLICGDVGYGKTEVALRASFMAAYNGKQTALLVPTTVLAEQHFKTFTDRYQDYAVNIACLSRFRKPREQREIVDQLKAGKIDIVIGTHRLLQKDVDFKELGLLIIDEEQRFGVKHKEKLKQLRKTVDVLALTATPIPRTLHMSLMGIRDISVISTPPEHRRPILTYISEFDDMIITGAIQKELERKGQIFFVHNNIHTIEAVANHLKRLVPEIRQDIAHGRMNEVALEKVMLRFINQEIDMLVCTTIIESGLDIPSANTILVNRADRFGLAQMYQLRGRVGRADEQAYAFLFTSRGSILTRDAQKRLKVLMEHSDLGSGFQIAMSDLKIRGGGTVLGAAQSGHIAAVGYDMFLQLMEDAIATLSGEPAPEPLEPEINVSLSSFIPESYIPDIDQRLSSYRRLSRMLELKEVSTFKAELEDRFGPLPSQAGNLLGKIMLKIVSRKAGVKKLDLKGNQLILKFSETHIQNPQGILEMVQSSKGNIEAAPDNVLKVNMAAQRTGGLLAEAKNILKEISQRVNC